jgi:hypothetical protein
LLIPARIVSSCWSLPLFFASSAVSLRLLFIWMVNIIVGFLESFASFTDLLASFLALLASLTSPIAASDVYWQLSPRYFAHQSWLYQIFGYIFAKSLGASSRRVVRSAILLLSLAYALLKAGVSAAVLYF